MRDSVAARLRAELEVRTRCDIQFTHKIPAEFRKCGRRSAFSSGYEIGWRGRVRQNPYTRPDCFLAFASGYEAGLAESAKEIERCAKEARDGR